MQLTFEYREMTKNSDTKDGFKKTEVGLIPGDWKAKSLGDSAQFRTGPFGSALHKSDYVDGGVPVINPMHIIDGRIIPSRNMTVAEKTAKRLSDFRLGVSNVIIGRRGDMGRCAVVQPHQAGWLCGTGSMIIRCKEGMNPSFLQRLLASPKIIAAIEDAAVGSTMINLNQAILSRLKIQCPSLPEQKAIAKALSDVDALITSLDQLIAKKRHIKQGAMQQLLTGKTRLPGFDKSGGKFKQTEVGMIPDDWKLATIASASGASMQNGVFFEPSRKGSGIKMVNVGDLYRQIPIDTDSLELFDANEDETRRFKVENGDLFFTRSSVVPSGIAHCNIYQTQNQEAVVFDSHVVRVRPDPAQVEPEYLFRQCRSALARKYLVSHAKTGTMTTIDQGVLGRCPVLMANKSEQKAIAKVLLDMDAEIDAIAARRDKTRLLKQGMMQELLTGRTRLV